MSQQLDLTSLIIAGIQDRKGHRISVVDLSHIESAAADKFIITEGTSAIQVGAIADGVRRYLIDKAGVKPFNSDGLTNGEWVVIDYGATWVHVFLREKRELYNLEELWSDAQIINVPDLD